MRLSESGLLQNCYSKAEELSGARLGRLIPPPELRGAELTAGWVASAHTSRA